jgi:integrase
VPIELASAFAVTMVAGKPYIVRSLGTADIRLANAKADALRAHFRTEFATVRATRSSPDLDSYLETLYDDELRKWNGQTADDARERLRTGTVHRLDQERARAAEARHDWSRALLSKDSLERRAVSSWAADAYYRSLGQEPDESAAYIEVVERCAATLVDAQITINDLVAGKGQISTPLSSRPQSPPKSIDSPDGNAGLSLGDYFKAVYMPAIRLTKTQKGERTLSGKARAVRLFEDLVGDHSIGSITSPQIWIYHDQLMKLPDINSLSGAWRSLTPRQQIAAIDSGKLIAEPLNPKTVNKHLTGIKTILDFAMKRRDITVSPAVNIRAEVPPEEDTGRSFTTDELNRIFGHPLFAGCSDGLVPKGLQKPGPVQVRDDRFWIPLVLLFTGARSSEVVGLHVDEVVVDHEVPHFIFQPNESRRLKNLQSKRMVPVHSALIEMGFLDFVENQQARSEGQFFALVVQQYFNESVTNTRQKKALSNSPIMRQFNRTILADADARANDGSIKCFRNTFEQEAAAVIPSDEVRRRLTGRDLQSSVQIYTKNIPGDLIKRTGQLRMLSNEINKISYDGVELDHLKLVASPL